jgi:chromosome segregation ATPase
MAAPEEDITKLNEQMSTMQNRLGPLEKKVGILDSKVSTLEMRLTKSDTNNQSYSLMLSATVVAIVVVFYLIRRYVSFVSAKDSLFK